MFIFGCQFCCTRLHVCFCAHNIFSISYICIISWALKWLYLKHYSFFRWFPYTFSDGTFSIYVKIVMDILFGIGLYFCKMVILTIFYQTMNMRWLSSFYCLFYLFIHWFNNFNMKTLYLLCIFLEILFYLRVL